MNLRTIAKITGGSLVAMAIVSSVSLVYAYETVLKAFQTETLRKAIEYFYLFKIIIIGLLLTIILDFIVSFTLYKYFKNDHKRISLIAAIFRVVYTLILLLSGFPLINCFAIWNSDQAGIINNLECFMFIWTSGLIIFGFHITLVGYLMKIHQKIPKILWIITLLAGVSYVIVHLLKVIPTFELLAKYLEIILMLPMAAGELGLAIWLIVKGGKVKKISLIEPNK